MLARYGEILMKWGRPGGRLREKCSLYEQKGGNEHHNKRKSKKSEEIPQIFITKKAILCGRTDGRKHFGPQSWGTSFLRPTRIHTI